MFYSPRNRGNMDRLYAFAADQFLPRRLLAHFFDLEKIEAAIPKLDDATLARLADESARINERFQAGHPYNPNWTAVIIVVATMAMIVLVVLITTR